MSLQASLELILAKDQPLRHLHDWTWQQLAAAAASPRHGWNQASLVTTDDRRPHSRMVVLPTSDATRQRLECHTDRRADKVQQIARCPQVAWMFWDPRSRIQLRLIANAEILSDNPDVDQAWRDVPLRSRSAYLSLAAPGRSVTTDHPPSTDDRDADADASERGRQNFCIVRTTIESADALYLRKNGHVRFALNNGTAAWLVP